MTAATPSERSDDSIGEPDVERLPVDAGAAIQARYFAPASGRPIGAVLIGGAMRGTRGLVDCYANAPRRVERVAPADVAARRIGHFGFFRDAFAPTLWARTADWLCEFTLAKETR